MIKSFSLSDLPQFIEDTASDFMELVREHNFTEEESKPIFATLNMLADLTHLLSHVNIHSLKEAIADFSACNREKEKRKLQ